jgi:hypothetical protein
MKNLFEAAEAEELKERMAQLSADSERQWDKMNPAQMLAHCSAAMGKISPPRILVGRLLGLLAKKSLIVNRTPMRRNSMTEKSCLVTDERDFVVERQRLRESIGLATCRSTNLLGRLLRKKPFGAHNLHNISANSRDASEAKPSYAALITE